MNILISGANGFIGSNLVRKLSEDLKGHTIYCLLKSKENLKHFTSKNLHLINHDLLNEGLPKGLPNNIDVIYHLAALSKTFLEHSAARKQFIQNVTLTSNIIEVAEHLSSKKIIFSSSVYIYSGTDSKPFSENMTLSPNESLGASKLASELLLKSYSISSGVDVSSLRLFTVYGPGSRKNQFIPEAIRKITDLKEEAEFGNPKVTRDFVYISDVIRAFALALKSNINGFTPINIASGETTSILEAVKTIKKVTGTDKSIKFNEINSLNHLGDSDHSASIALAKRILGWKPRINFKQGIIKTIENDF